VEEAVSTDNTWLVVGLLLLALVVLLAVLWSLLRDVERLEGRQIRHEGRIRAELDALRAATQINLAFWTTRRAMQAEAERAP
jgi:formate-dependent nitrite reductase membrane component NrfD